MTNIQIPAIGTTFGLAVFAFLFAYVASQPGSAIAHLAGLFATVGALSIATGVVFAILTVLGSGPRRRGH